MGRIEKSDPQDLSLSSLGKPSDGDPPDGFFYPTLTFMIDSYSMKRAKNWWAPSKLQQ